MLKRKIFPVLNVAMLVGSLVISHAALAHAHLKSQTPTADKDIPVQNAPSSLTLLFSEQIEPAFSNVELTLAGQSVPVGKATVESGHRNVLVVPLEKPLVSGSYQVSWRVLSVDGHKTEGSYRFGVK
ncbi:copper homeostasis periplasmic binding protein CopC [Dickeya solani]|uniref:Copper resistance protein C n=1 Tax=Dickeya solani TaxID=1089444 RepID=A0ABU4E9E9_9GAMM|nr:copper homeostasis periplasmic binding protein CopC [Dickeya solani]MCA6998788.1 copper homeostasis periplasmic binding protein CopC [Dickeya solani]MCZ0822239.1 copper homeostasis periplasmic binding protein CopC [Dickeya solani]MDV6994662.1 copper homeostasis periplasmic binding protein CopC [Dickeya solani]MDV7004041.1 copper homeostasis periplasmic binding protein CopC [Dickeya solani]MDV7039788.1 copper homeostasis periplasmic binding protein CopC [Dickeya solani]